ncbi:MAG: hypothetical protein LKJ17_09395 [Oscillospiraceae bacterium]|jgi:hypothetical protein|nr:hypothetical protein [Oscillospiraceae bacterium]
MTVQVQQIISEAQQFSRLTTLKRYAYYETLKSKLSSLDITNKEYQQAARKIADALEI